MDINKNNELQNLLDKASTISDEKLHIKKKNSSNKNNNEVLEYEIREGDTEFVQVVKNAVNNSTITKGMLYDKFGATNGFNMHYTLDKNELGIKRLLQWCEILNVELKITLIPK